MSKIKLADRLSFVRSLELAPIPKSIAALGHVGFAAEEDKKSAAVDAGSLVSFVGGLSKTHQSDVLNSTLLAQLAANKKYDRESQTKEWYGFYRNVLENVGWVIQEFDFTKFNDNSASFSVDEVVIKLLAAIATQNDIAVVAETIEAMKALGSDDGRVKLFDHNSTNLQKGNFQIGVANDADGVVVMKMAAFYFNTDQSVTNVLWFRFQSANTSMYQSKQVINLDNDVYAQVRADVIAKLGDNARKFVAEIEI